MTTATHTLPNGCVVQIDLDAIPDEAQWIMRGPDCWCVSPVRPQLVRDKGLLDWLAPGWDYTKCTIVVLSGTLPAWSECIIDLEAVRAKALTDDGPPRLYDVVESRGQRVWFMGHERDGAEGPVWHALRRVTDGLKAESAWPNDMKCTVIARNVYDIRDAMRLMGES